MYQKVSVYISEILKVILEKGLTHFSGNTSSWLSMSYVDRSPSD